MKPITAIFKDERGDELYVKIVHFVERTGQVLALCVYKDEIVAIAPSELKIVRFEDSQY